MSDRDDSGAAGRIRDAITLGARTGLECATVHRDDLRAVLAENEAMRKQLAGLRTQEAVLWYDDDHDCWRPSEFRTVAIAIDEEGGQLQWRDGSRLVGEWRPAEGGDPE